ncbi:MAG: 5-(carboxyamino)imidazole ribonucleotide synthase [Pseudomonadota bacterium]
MILPGATIGMLGGGQLGRMFVMAANSLGYRVIVLDPDADSPAGRMADEHIQTSFSDSWAIEQLAKNCQAVTTEFENIPTETLEILEKTIIVRPSSQSVTIAQNRIIEKTFLADNQFPTARFYPVYNKEDLNFAMSQMATTCILKVATLGYDGKGQSIVNNISEAEQAFDAMGQVACVLEEKVDLKTEISLVLARSFDGQVSCYPIGENYHVNGILEHTVVPCNLDEKLKNKVIDEAIRLANGLEYCGVLAVEFFYTTAGKLLINEIAPRPHNSGHYTMDACVTSQFEQQVRMLCGLPAGSTKLLTPVVMFNILGDVWENGEPDWLSLLSKPEVKLHLYGKSQAREGRKMGHFNYIGSSTEELLKQTRLIANSLPKP